MTRWEMAEQRALWALVGASTTGDPARIEARTVVVTGEVVS